MEQKIHPLDEALSYAINGTPERSEEILREQPQNDYRVLFNLGWHEMRKGNMKKAFEHFNYGRFIDVFGLPALPGKIWKDEPLEGKTLLFRCEGGYGDQILNFRFAKRFEEMGARVLVSCATEYMTEWGEANEIQEGTTINHIWRWEVKLFTPIPSLALHMGYERQLDPYIDWKKLWDSIV